MKTLRVMLLFLVASLLSQVATAAGDPLDQWHQLDTDFHVPTFVPFGAGKWLKLDGQHLLSSTNKEDWKVTRTFPLEESATGLVFGRGLWVLAGTRNSTNLFILTSADGETWNAPAIPQTSGLDAQILQSLDEWVVWSRSTGLLLRSPDGQSWTSSRLGSSPSNVLNGQRILDIVYADGRWVAIVNEDDNGSGSLAVSTNLTEWRWWLRRALWGGRLFVGFTYAHGLWFGVSRSEWVTCSAGTAVITSADGTNWTHRFFAPPGLDFDGQIHLANNRLFASASSVLCGVINTNSPPRLPTNFQSDPLLSLQQRGQGEIVVTRASGIPVVVEASADLRRWQTLTNLSLGEPIQSFTDPTAASSSARFYRAQIP